MKDSKHRVVLNSKWPIRANITMTIFDRLSNFALSLKRVTHSSAGKRLPFKLTLGNKCASPTLVFWERTKVGWTRPGSSWRRDAARRKSRKKWIHPSPRFDGWRLESESKSLWNEIFRPEIVSVLFSDTQRFDAHTKTNQSPSFNRPVIRCTLSSDTQISDTKIWYQNLDTIRAEPWSEVSGFDTKMNGKRILHLTTLLGKWWCWKTNCCLVLSQGRV